MYLTSRTLLLVMSVNSDGSDGEVLISWTSPYGITRTLTSMEGILKHWSIHKLKRGGLKVSKDGRYYRVTQKGIKLDLTDALRVRMFTVYPDDPRWKTDSDTTLANVFAALPNLIKFN